MNPNVKKHISWLRRYFSLVTIAVMLLIVYMIFFSETSVMQKIEYQRIIDSLRTELADANDSIEYYQDLNSRLRTDREVVEQEVREKHNMKRPDEDVYLYKKEQ